MNLAESLEKGIKKLNLDASSEQQNKLLTLLEQLVKWNNTYNLTAIKNPMEGLTLHILDSLAVTTYIDQKTLLDVGTGAGFPGLPLAIMLPQVKFTLLDSNNKKTRFIRQQVHLLELDNVEVVHSRVEKCQLDPFDAIISRAFASLQDMICSTQHLLKENGCWLAMKGNYNPEELAEISDLVKEDHYQPLNIPGLLANRCLITLKFR